MSKVEKNRKGDAKKTAVRITCLVLVGILMVTSVLAALAGLYW